MSKTVVERQDYKRAPCLVDMYEGLSLLHIGSVVTAVIREVYAQIPPRVEYTLTAVGYALKPVIDSMVAWGAEYRENMMLGIENLA